MPDDDDIAQLRKGVGAWNAWRDENPNVVHPDRGCTTLSSCSTAIECDATDRKLPQPERSHKPWSDANGQCGKSVGCVRRGGDCKRGTRQSSTLLVGRIEETSASFEARSAPRSYPTPTSGHRACGFADVIFHWESSVRTGLLPKTSGRREIYTSVFMDDRQRDPAATHRRHSGGQHLGHSGAVFDQMPRMPLSRETTWPAGLHIAWLVRLSPKP